MVKTILHEICKAKGRDVYQYTKHIPGADLDPANRCVSKANRISILTLTNVVTIYGIDQASVDLI